MIGVSSGRMMRRKMALPPAPSTRAASNSSRSIPWSAGEDEDRAEGRHLPDVGDDHHPHRRRVLGQPWDVFVQGADLGEQRVERAVGRVVDPAPHQGVDDRRQRPGQDHQRPEQPAEPHRLVHQHRQADAEAELERGRHDREEERLVDRVPEARAGQLRDVVAQADERLDAGADQLDVEQAHPRGTGERSHDHEEDDEGGGGHEGRRHPRLGPRPRPLDGCAGKRAGGHGRVSVRDAGGSGCPLLLERRQLGRDVVEGLLGRLLAQERLLDRVLQGVRELRVVRHDRACDEAGELDLRGREEVRVVLGDVRDRRTTPSTSAARSRRPSPATSRWP